MIRNGEGHTQYQRKNKHENSAGKDCQAQKLQRAGVRANFFRGHQIDREARRSRQRHRVAKSKLGVLGEIRAHDDQRSGYGESQANPERKCRATTENQPRQESYDDGSIVAEQCGVGRAGLQDGGVVKSQIEREEKSADSNDGITTLAEFLAAARNKERRKQDNGGNQQSIKSRCWAGNRSPANEDCRPRDAHNSSEEGSVRPRFAWCGLLHEVATWDWAGDFAGKSMTEIQRTAATKLEWDRTAANTK